MNTAAALPIPPETFIDELLIMTSATTLLEKHITVKKKDKKMVLNIL
jgi:hypothetical protein